MSYRLTFEDAVTVWVLSWLGWKQHDIAARYGVNSGRVNEVLKHSRHPGSHAAAYKRMRSRAEASALEKV